MSRGQEGCEEGGEWVVLAPRGQGARPAVSALICSGTTPGSAVKEARPRREADLRQRWARFSSSCKQGISQVNIEHTSSEGQPSGASHVQVGGKNSHPPVLMPLGREEAEAWSSVPGAQKGVRRSRS